MFDFGPGPLEGSECLMLVLGVRMFNVNLGPPEGSECLMLSFTLAQHARHTVPDYRFAFPIFSSLTPLYFGERATAS